MLVVNAGNTDSDLAWILAHNRWDAECANRSADTGLVAIQGTASGELLQPLTDADLQSMRRFRILRDRVGDVPACIATTGYTGEYGFEVFCSAADTPALWSAVLDAGEALGVLPAGLGARDILRIEAGYPLYGNELTREITPVEARLLWTVKPDKGRFLGREAIQEKVEEGPERLLVGLEAIGRCVPRHGYQVLSGNYRAGEVTSGTFSPTLGKGIAMAYVDPEHAEVATRLDVPVRTAPCACQVVPMPFHRTKAGKPAPAGR
jgi:aminomethyltransferase